MKSTEELKEYILFLLEEAGFSPELYILKIGVSSVEVHFDHPGAVDYFKGEVETCDRAEELIFDKRQSGKRYVAYIQMW
jgi:hypothetical protein